MMRVIWQTAGTDEGIPHACMYMCSPASTWQVFQRQLSKMGLSEALVDDVGQEVGRARGLAVSLGLWAHEEAGCSGAGALSAFEGNKGQRRRGAVEHG